MLVAKGYAGVALKGKYKESNPCQLDKLSNNRELRPSSDITGCSKIGLPEQRPGKEFRKNVIFDNSPIFNRCI